jgi:hypothetical protein
MASAPCVQGSARKDLERPDFHWLPLQPPRAFKTASMCTGAGRTSLTGPCTHGKVRNSNRLRLPFPLSFLSVALPVGLSRLVLGLGVDCEKIWMEEELHTSL